MIVIVIVFLGASFNVGVTLYFKHILHNNTQHPHHHYH